jgi:peptidyl-prolyl cis-trans isomerase D
MDGGGYAVFVVSKVNDGDLATLQPEQRQQLQQQVTQMRGRSAVESFVESLRKRYRITLQEARLQ